MLLQQSAGHVTVATQPAGGKENTVNLTVWSRAAIIYSAALLGLTIACFWPGIICSAIGYFWAIAVRVLLYEVQNVPLTSL